MEIIIMGYTTQHGGRRPAIIVPSTGQFLNSTCVKTNQSNEGIRYSVVFTEIFFDNVEIQEPLGSSDHNQLHFIIKIKSDKTKVNQCRRDFRKGNYTEIRKSLAHRRGSQNEKQDRNRMVEHFKK